MTTCSFDFAYVSFVNVYQNVYVLHSVLVFRVGCGIKLVTLVYFSWLGLNKSCLVLSHSGFNWWFPFVRVFQWCCLTLEGPRESNICFC